MNPNRSAEVLSENLSASFKKRVARGDKFPLIWAMHETFKTEFWIGGFCNLFANVFMVISPFTLRYLISFANQAYNAQRDPGGTPAPNIGRGIGLVFGIVIMQVLQSLGTTHFIYRGMMVGGQSRAVMITVIFEKAMKISGRAKAGGKAMANDSMPSETDRKESENAKKEGWLKAMMIRKLEAKSKPKGVADNGEGVSGDGMGWGNGRVVNLMSTDTYRIDQASGMFHMIWTSPIAILITLVVLLINISYSALAGFALLVLGVPILTKVIGILFHRRKAINKVTDQRVSLTQEILQAVRFVKYFGWESSFLERINDIRKREIHMIQTLLAIRNAINAVSMSLPIFASMLSFITYSLTDHELNPAYIFSSLALFNSLRMPLNLLPMVIGQVIDGWASVGRIQEFLLAEEQKDDFEWDYAGKDATAMRHADFTWERTVTQDPEKVKVGNVETKSQIKASNKAEKKAAKEAAKAAKRGANGEKNDSAVTLAVQEPFKLKDVNFTIGRNELVAVIGGVGSGKSSLLAALAGDMRKTSGEIMMGASRALCPQYAWIQNATVKENILFGKDYDADYYNKVIDACALRPDLEMLPNGDDTEIGERGITISGGQKQRLNIARAIYFNSDIVLMDDPLSAVDAHVGR